MKKSCKALNKYINARIAILYYQATKIEWGITQIFFFLIFYNSATLIYQDRFFFLNSFFIVSHLFYIFFSNYFSLSFVSHLFLNNFFIFSHIFLDYIILLCKYIILICCINKVIF